MERDFKMEIVNKEWKIKQTERGDGTSLIQVYFKDKQKEAFVCDTMNKTRLTNYLKKKVKDANISL